MKKIVMLSLSFLLIFSFSSIAQDIDSDILMQRQAELQTLINESGGGWTVGDNPVARMSDEDFRGMLGALEDPNPPAFYGIDSFDETQYSAALPSSYSWKQYMTSVKNQKKCGSCWAFSTCAALEGVLKKETGKSYNLSEQLMVSTCCSAGDCNGGYISQANSFAVNTGIPEESCYPYRAANSSCSSACSGWKQKTFKAKNTYSVSQSTNSIKSAIYNKGPVNIVFKVFSDFRNYNGGIYRYSSGTSEGLHAVVAVGYNDSNGGYFTVKNSWGTSWGESGYFRIAYSQVNNSVGFGQQAHVFSSGGGPNPPQPEDGCKGHCGGKAPSGCYCDSQCEYYGDCCADKKKYCGF